MSSLFNSDFMFFDKFYSFKFIFVVEYLFLYLCFLVLGGIFYFDVYEIGGRLNCYFIIIVVG